MKLFDDCWTAIVHILNVLSLTSWSGKFATEQPLQGSVLVNHPSEDYPIFHPPNGPEDFRCEYPEMPGWKSCSTPTNRKCWLKKGKEEYNIRTDYENTKITPKGIVRKYSLELSNMTLTGDGFKNPYGKVFNQSYPGPWIRACWGDTLEINVTNHLKWNGTTIHWHGIRQLHTMEMDGVNGVTQCPIAPGDSMLYKFHASQYGTTWYHSHYALQYADGLLGPLTIFGPSSANYTDAVDPLLMTDYGHKSAFAKFYREIRTDVVPGGPPTMESILLNGTGPYHCSAEEAKAGNCTDPASHSLYNTTFTKGGKYLMRLINTAVDTDFIFAIDNHKITVMSSDFVPIEPYVTDSVLVGIGQRYHIVVEANPVNDTRPAIDRSYWIRTIPAFKCNGFNNTDPVNKTGILYYHGADRTKLPTTEPCKYPIACSDEPYEKLVPVVPWTIGPPSNDEIPSIFQVGLDQDNDTILPPSEPKGSYQRWEMATQPLWLNFTNPTILGLEAPGSKKTINWPVNYVVVPELTTEVSNDKWIYLLVNGMGFPWLPKARTFFPVAHPIHLHGHDFAILSQSNAPYWPGITKIKTDNPPRRDVALLPAGGHLLIAFKADNPGAWLMHCHIAWHASSGLAAQILEREQSISFAPGAMDQVHRVCNNWEKWYSNSGNWWSNSSDFQDDSGI